MRALRGGGYLLKHFSSFRAPHLRFFCVQDRLTRFREQPLRMPHLTWRPQNRDFRAADLLKDDAQEAHALNLIHLQTARRGVDLAPGLFKRKGGRPVDHGGRPIPPERCAVLIFHAKTLGLSFLSQEDQDLWMNGFAAIIQRNQLYNT
ncbi:unnamed protein product [Phytomonas sp. Hart1]|nr:unnamed protein product [Phytomonas sp. Hart1]|eukprot:CCW71668.1 unnamed protein product [Phytomonas sp. isolate Hart1]